MIGNAQNIHFIGIGGIGMSALARLLLHDKKNISGSDREPSLITEALRSEGVTIFDFQVRENITPEIDFVVYTEAMPRDHEEMSAARKLGVPMVNYFEALGQVANRYYLVAIAGTHGKTTTTAMLTEILEAAGLDPTAIIGSLRLKTKSNFRAGKSKYMVVEACEYRRDFLFLTPDVLVITNIEAEHLDYYKNLKDVQDAFHELCNQVREGGAVICNRTNHDVIPVVTGIDREIIDYRTQSVPLQKLKLPGVHNQLNAAAAKAAALHIGVKESMAREALEQFSGTWRRFEYKGEMKRGVKVYDDYGHHPTEITATLSGMRELFPDKEIILIFQPHLYSRTEELFDDFVDSLSAADRIILTKVYDARDTGKRGVTGKTLADAIHKKNTNIDYIDDADTIVSRIKSVAAVNDVILVMGAGDIYKVADMLIH